VVNIISQHSHRKPNLGRPANFQFSDRIRNVYMSDLFAGELGLPCNHFLSPEARRGWLAAIALISVQFVLEINHSEHIPQQCLVESYVCLIILKQRASISVSCIINFVCFVARIHMIDDTSTELSMLMNYVRGANIAAYVWPT
jgi:hypothetical protein